MSSSHRGNAGPPGRRPGAAARGPGGPRRPEADAPLVRHRAGATPPAARALPEEGHALRHRPAPSADAPGEQRLYGFNACLAAFAKRPEALRKAWLRESRIPQLQPLLAWCVQHRLGYRVVADADLDRLAGSQHHEGVVLDLIAPTEPKLGDWLRGLAPGPAVALWLDGVGNPHNLGAILRSAAHFGAGAVLLPPQATLAVSGAAARVAEGGAEALPLVRMGRTDNSLGQLRSAGFEMAATVVRGGEPVFTAALPARLVLVMGAEGQGVDARLADACGLRVGLPGTGAVESLNVAAATAVFLAEWRRRHPFA